MAEWRTVPVDMKYWHPVNHGFNSTNSKFMCSDCGAQIPVGPCAACGHSDRLLGTGMGLPGVFCAQCGSGGISWECPKCKRMHKMMLVFYYDILKVNVKKKGFWD